jgi:hypothetical protein
MVYVLEGLVMEPMVPTAEALARRTASLGRLRIGNPVDLASPLVGSKHPDKDAKRAEVWADFRKALKLSVLPRSLRDRETEEAAKMGPLSYLLPYTVATTNVPSLKSQVLRYFTPKKVNIEMSAAKVADRAVKALFQISMYETGKLRPLGLDEAAGLFPGGKNLGHPVYSSSATFLNAVLEESRQLQRELPNEMLDQYPAVLVTRLDSSGPYQASKARSAFSCSRVVGNLAQVYRAPLFKALAENETFCAWEGRMSVRFAMTKLFEDFPSRDIISLDYSGFDASVPMEVMLRIWAIWMDVFPKSSRRELEWLRDEFLQEGLWTPEGLQSGRCGGLPSGSPFTNVMGSLVNVWCANYASTRINNRLDRLFVNGDDGVVVLGFQTHAFKRDEHRHSAVQFAQVLKEDLGMTLNVEKGVVADGEAVFLQDSYLKGHYANDGLLRAFRPAARVLRKAMGYERYRTGWSAACDTLRWLQQWDALQDHYCFPAACDWLREHDGWLSPNMSIDSLVENAGGLKHASNLLNEPNGTKVSVGNLKWSKVAKQLGLS